MNVVVIGGGVIGYSVAHALAARRARVEVIDPRRPGGGATQASAGMLAPYIEGHDERLLNIGVASLSLYADFVRSLRRDGAADIEFGLPGTLQLAWSSSRAETLKQAALQLAARNATHTLLSAREVHEREPAIGAGVLNGLLVGAHGYVHVGDLMTGLVRAAACRGVTSSVARVTALEPGPSGVRVLTTEGVREATVAVVAAGSWSGELGLVNSASIPVKPIRGQSLELAFETPPLRHVVWGEDCYLVPRRNGSLIVGATVEDVGFDESSTEEGVAALRARAEAVLPGAIDAPLMQVRVGLRPATADELPIIGWSSALPGVCLATGHYRNGILLAPLTAQMVADLVMGENGPGTAWAREAVAPSRLGL